MRKTGGERRRVAPLDWTVSFPKTGGKTMERSRRGSRGSMRTDSLRIAGSVGAGLGRDQCDWDFTEVTLVSTTLLGPGVWRMGSTISVMAVSTFAPESSSAEMRTLATGLRPERESLMTPLAGMATLPAWVLSVAMPRAV